MVELISFITGSVFLFIALKILLMKVFFDTIKAVVLHKYSIIIILAVIVSFLIVPDVVTPYFDMFLEYFINGIQSIFTFTWEILTQMFESIL
jgi:hypothetical protein